MTDLPRLLARAKAKGLKNARTMAAKLSALDPAELVDEYFEMMAVAPRRGADGYEYFIARTGRPPQKVIETRREERLAMALANDKTTLTAGGETIKMLMYAFPLFTTGGTKGIRGVDVVGHSAETQRFWVVELKIAAQAGKTGESPLRALYEALVYGAVVEANTEHIARELEDRGRKVDHRKPGLLIAAPTDYWERWLTNPGIDDWWTPYFALTAALSEQLATPIETIDLGPISYRIDLEDRPRVQGHLDCQPTRYP